MPKDERREAYLQKLRDPRWQRRRLEIMERDHFACRWCRGDKETLNVHHLYYESGREPWDYPAEAFLTLCETCHEQESAYRKESEVFLLTVLRKKSWSWVDVDNLAWALDRSQLPEGAVILERMLEFIAEHPEFLGWLRDSYVSNDR